MRLSDGLAGFWLEKEIHLSTATIRDYTTPFTRLQNFLGNPIFANITADDIRRFLAHVQKKYSLGKKTLVNHWIIDRPAGTTITRSIYSHRSAGSFRPRRYMPIVWTVAIGDFRRR